MKKFSYSTEKSKWAWTCNFSPASLAYTSKGRTPIQVFPVQHAYPKIYSAFSCIHDVRHEKTNLKVFVIVIEMHMCMRRHNRFWCMHVGLEVPVLVYTRLMCAPVACLGSSKARDSVLVCVGVCMYWRSLQYILERDIWSYCSENGLSFRDSFSITEQ